jgi:hypothetical protein
VRIADLSLQGGDAAGAVAWYQRAVEVGGADVPLLVKMAQAQWSSGAGAAALTTIQRALEKDPANRDALALLGRVRIPNP